MIVKSFMVQLARVCASLSGKWDIRVQFVGCKLSHATTCTKFEYLFHILGGMSR
jgi:hypothetical protein